MFTFIFVQQTYIFVSHYFRYPHPLNVIHQILPQQELYPLFPDPILVPGEGLGSLGDRMAGRERLLQVLSPGSCQMGMALLGLRQVW